jgi:mRNA-degrading endonuclease RelE of RelBE toxin-antitoxin system
MELVLSERVKVQLLILSDDERKRVQTWIDYLRNWEEDSFVQAHSVPLTVQGKSVYLFRTTTELRIFYTVDLQTKTVHVIDLTSRDTILATGGAPAGGS